MKSIFAGSGLAAGRTPRSIQWHEGSLAESLRRRCVQFFDVSDQLVFVSHAAEVETDHFIRTKRWFFAGPQTNEQTGNDRAIGLNLDAVLVAAEQVAAAKHCLLYTSPSPRDRTRSRMPSSA